MEFVEVTLIHITNGNEYYEVKQSNDHKKRGTYKVGDDFWYENELHQQPISKSTKALFEAAHDKFVEQVTRAKNGQDGYMVVSIDNYYVAYKRLLQETTYDFILTCDRYTRIFTNTTIYDFHRSLILPSDSPQEEKNRLEKVTHSLLESASFANDLYLAYALKECLGTITQSEADYLLSIDGIYRFIPENKIYDMGDLEILDVQSGTYTFSSRTVNFTCVVKIKGIVHKAIWKPNDTKYSKGGYPPYKVDPNSNPNELLILSKVFYRKIRISDLVQGTIDSIAYNNLTRTYTLFLPITPDSPEKDNRIKAKVRKLGFGIKEYIGRFIENDSTIDERILLVFDITIKKAKELGKEFGLSSIIYKDQENCREICISTFTHMEKVNDQEVTQTYYPDDIVRVYHNTYLNEDLIKEILFTRRGPVGVDFELYEVEQPRPSYFQDKEHHKKATNT